MRVYAALAMAILAWGSEYPLIKSVATDLEAVQTGGFTSPFGMGERITPVKACGMGFVCCGAAGVVLARYAPHRIRSVAGRRRSLA